MEKIDVNSLPKEKVEKLQDIFRVINTLNEFDKKATKDVFEYMFEGLGQYMIEKYVIDHKRNIMSFFRSLDEKSKSTFVTELFGHADMGSPYYLDNPIFLKC